MSIAYPLINGNRFDYSSIEINLDGLIYRGVKSIDYSDQLIPGKVKGTSAMAVGRTRGDYEAEASIEVFKEEWALLAAGLASKPPYGLGEVTFGVVVAYADFGAVTVVDTLGACRIKKPSESHAQGSEGLTVKIDLDPLYILHNGIALLSPQAFMK